MLFAARKLTPFLQSSIFGEVIDVLLAILLLRRLVVNLSSCPSQIFSSGKLQIISKTQGVSKFSHHTTFAVFSFFGGWLICAWPSCCWGDRLPICQVLPAKYAAGFHIGLISLPKLRQACSSHCNLDLSLFENRETALLSTKAKQPNHIKNLIVFTFNVTSQHSQGQAICHVVQPNMQLDL